MIAGRNLGNCCPAYQLVTQLALSGCSTIRCVAPYNTAGNTLRSFIIRFSSSSSSSSQSSSGSMRSAVVVGRTQTCPTSFKKSNHLIWTVFIPWMNPASFKCEQIGANGSYLEFHDRGVAISDAIFSPFSFFAAKYCCGCGQVRAILQQMSFCTFKVSKWSVLCAKSSNFVYTPAK